MAQPVPAVALVRSIWTLNAAQYAVTTMHYQIAAAQIVSQTTANEIAAAYGAAFSAGLLRAQISTTVVLDQIGVRDLRTEAQPEFTANVGVAGTAAADVLPPGVALVATLRTPLAGRSFRGRWYQPGFAENANLGSGVAGGAAQGELQLFVDDIRAMTIETLAWDGSVVSRFSGGLERPTPVVTTISSVVVRDGRWDTQRRRGVPGI